MQIREVLPPMALPDGLVRLKMEGVTDLAGLIVLVGGVAADLQGASTSTLTIKIPPASADDVRVCNGASAKGPLRIGRILNSDLHPVANPVVDDLGNVFVTYSGTRGEKVSFGVFMVTPDGNTQPFLGDITNPTGMTIGPDGYLYVSSRHSGEIYRSSFDKQVEKYAEGLGLATGLVFDSQGNLFVGDRSGSIYKISPDREPEPFCEIEPSVSAFHLAIDPDDNLYVTGPTLATQDAVYRISPQGEPEVYFRGLGRPQGIGFDPQGNLQVAASYRGRKGLYTFEDGTPRLRVAGPMLVGFAYSPDESYLYCVDNSSLFQIELKD